MRDGLILRNQSVQRQNFSEFTALYFGAYYATWTLPNGMLWGTVPHYQYKVGSVVLPNAAYDFFSPADEIDRQIRPSKAPE